MLAACLRQDALAGITAAGKNNVTLVVLRTQRPLVHTDKNEGGREADAAKKRGARDRRARKSVAQEINTKHREQKIGAWLSLVERCVRDAEAAGSNPVAPIK